MQRVLTQSQSSEGSHPLSAQFSGVSVTILLKRDMMSQLDVVAPEAKAIGAVNTVIPFTNTGGHRGLLGDNADWIAIRNVVKACLPPSLNKADNLLVISAGGTTHAEIYALHNLGASRIYLFNRTRRSAEELVHVIPNGNVALLDTLDVTSVQGPTPSIIVSTAPASTTTTEEHVPDALFLPSSLFTRMLASSWGLQARRDAAAETGQDGGGRQVVLGYGDRGASRAGLQAI